MILILRIEFSATEEVVPDYDPDDLYDGSDASLDEEDTGDDTKEGEKCR